MALLYLHGGGYVTGSPRTHRALAGRLAQRLRADTYVPEYRLAPEHPYPAAAADAVAAYQALVEIGWPPERIIIAGDSAGAALSMAVAIAARDCGIPMPAAVGLICPAVDLTDRGCHTLRAKSRDSILTKSMIQRFVDAYAPGERSCEPAASPLRASLAGLPPIVIDAAQYDLLVDEARLLSVRAREAGLSVDYREHPRLWHDFHLLAGVLPQANSALDRFADTLSHYCREVPPR
ncbi:alpha/beta hydrolase [Mycobacteroides stephanolepidis]|nr:alpha/beta hydrolase [[Mycobacterium] stephanolepidis]